jgi:hypothetical protein
MSDKAIIWIVALIAAGLVSITGIVVGGAVLGEPTLLVPGNLRAERAEDRAKAAEEKQSRAEHDLYIELHPGKAD